MTFEEYETQSLKTAIYPGQGYPTGLQYVALKMNGEAGELAEHIGKAMRDESFGVFNLELTESRKELIKKEIGDVLWYLAAAAREVNTSLSEIAEGNIQKLADRAKRNALQGSGDNR
jgi:NTP pyrophosphatase (non-canonical NTP hydrolase)